MKLVIVESPTKAKTITKYLGKPFTVVASYGHIRDLPKSKMGIDIANDFQPQYIIPTKARKTVTALKKLAAKASTIILATDEDREGEAIAWHLTKALGLASTEHRTQNTELPKIERIAFHEITKEAIEEALKNPRELDERLIDAQQARRILDRLVGYELSPFLWRKIYRGLSAGRVQSVAVRLIVEREREIQKFKAEEYWTIEGKFLTPNKAIIEAKLHSQNGKTLDKFAITSESAANDLVSILKKSNYRVAKIERKAIKKNAPAPFTTSLLQQEASRRLGLSPKQTMMIAQQLYEGVALGDEGSVGLITYMRTDSMNLAEKFLHEAKEFLASVYGERYAASAPRRFKSKSKNAQEAHEAIRPTDPRRQPENVKNYLEPRQYKLYDLIWRRTMASQMPEAEIETTAIDIAGNERAEGYLFRATGSVIVFDGWRRLYAENNDEQTLPKVAEGAALKLQSLDPLQHFTEPPPRYSEATLIKALEEYGIGRPSTYAPTVSTVVDRGYVEREDRRLKPTELAFLVNDLLVEHFPKIVDYQFTAHFEEELDDIAEGTKQMLPVLKEFYEPFKQNLMDKEATLSKKDISEEATDEKCELCGKPMVIKFGRYGKFLACSGFPECKNAKPLAGTPEAEGTDEVCDKCGKPMQIKRGRFGTFLGCTGYPECKNIKSMNKKTGVACPDCGQGEIVEKRSKRGRNFYSCNRYPDCKFALWSKPTGEKCPKCDSLIVFAAKGTVRCSSKDCDYQGEAPTQTD